VPATLGFISRLAISDSSGFLRLLGSFGFTRARLALARCHRFGPSAGPPQKSDSASQKCVTMRHHRPWGGVPKPIRPACRLRPFHHDLEFRIPAALGFVRFSHRHRIAQAGPARLSLAPVGGKVAIASGLLRMIPDDRGICPREPSGQERRSEQE
jgi:hypothetical protein